MNQPRKKDDETVLCACGCGTDIHRIDSQGRIRRYAKGHHQAIYTASFRFNNPIVECACGCGETFSLYNRKGKERKYAKGHHRRKIGDLEKVYEAVIQNGTPGKAAKVLHLNKKSITSLLKRNGIQYQNDLTKTGGSTAFGRQAELDAIKFLRNAVDATCNDPQKSPFDLLWEGLRLNVKASTTKDSGYSLRWSFHTEKPEQCDYFFCMGYDKKLEVETIFLIPSDAVPISLSIPINLKSKWAKYLIWRRNNVAC